MIESVWEENDLSLRTFFEKNGSCFKHFVDTDSPSCLPLIRKACRTRIFSEKLLVKFLDRIQTLRMSKIL